MKVLEAIEQIKALKPNAYDNQAILVWLNDLEAMVQSEVFEIPFEQVISYRLPEDQNKSLVIPAPYNGCYRYYIAAQIDFNKQETGSYQNNQLMFNETYAEFKRDYLRKAKAGDSLKVMNFD